MESSQISDKHRSIIGVSLLLLVVAAMAVWAKPGSYNGASREGTQSESEVAQVVRAVGKTLLLPEEVPTLATVSDPSQLKDQPFFAQALEGDKVLIYPGARKAILWRPSTKKVIEISSLNIATSTAEVSTTPL